MLAVRAKPEEIHRDRQQMRLSSRELLNEVATVANDDRWEKHGRNVDDEAPNNEGFINDHGKANGVANFAGGGEENSDDDSTVYSETRYDSERTDHENNEADTEMRGSMGLAKAEEADFESHDETWRRRNVVRTMLGHEEDSDENNGQAIQQLVPNLDETCFGDINITKSKHVHVGNTNFYKGPVTIKQFIYQNDYPAEKKEENCTENDIGNIRNGRISDVNKNNLPNYKGDPDRPILPDDFDKVTKWLWTWRCAVFLCIMALSSVTVVVVVFVVFSNNSSVGKETKLPDTPTSGTKPDGAWVNSVRFVERNEWIAQPAKQKADNLTEVPTPYVIISHTATEPCETQSDCVFRVRYIQTFHMESRGWDDIAYNFLVGGDGLAYVGRGWDAMGAHTFGWNTKSIGISFIGTFNDVPPYKKQLHAAEKVIELGVRLGKISPTYKVLGHRQLSATLSPGDKLYDILKTWEHWSPEP